MKPTASRWEWTSRELPRGRCQAKTSVVGKGRGLLLFIKGNPPVIKILCGGDIPWYSHSWPSVDNYPLVSNIFQPWGGTSTSQHERKWGMTMYWNSKWVVQVQVFHGISYRMVPVWYWNIFNKYCRYENLRWTFFRWPGPAPPTGHLSMNRWATEDQNSMRVCGDSMMTYHYTNISARLPIVHTVGGTNIYNSLESQVADTLLTIDVTIQSGSTPVTCSFCITSLRFYAHDDMKLVALLPVRVNGRNMISIIVTSRTWSSLLLLDS